MHRTYKPILPTHSKLLQQRWDSAYYEEHRRRVASASSTIDTRPPKTYMHLHLKLKRLQVEEERLAVIERDNRTLLTKMSIIMKTNGGIDNQNNSEYKSLNREKRLRELLRSTKENEEMMKRISNKKPQYDHTQWERDWVMNQQHMEQISAYPKDWWKDDSQSRTTSARTSQRSKSCQRGNTASSRSHIRSANSQRDKSAASRSDAKSHRSSTGQAESKPHPAPGHQDSKSKPANSRPDSKPAAAQPVKSTVGQPESAKKY